MKWIHKFPISANSADSKIINVFLTLDQRVVDGYFNKHDPSPIYKRQLSYQFEGVHYVVGCSCKYVLCHFL